MKKFAYTIFAAALIAATTLKASAQSGETRQVSGFNTVASSGPFDVHIKINGTESLKIVAESDVIKEIETVVEGGKLRIKFRHHENWGNENYGRIDVYITAKALSALANAGSGSIKVEGALSGDNVNISLSGSGNITSAVKADDLHAAVSGSGTIDLNGSASETKINITGSGDVNGKSFRTATASVFIAGSGSAHLEAETAAQLAPAG